MTAISTAYAKLAAFFRGRRRVWSVALYGGVTALPQIASGLLALLYATAFSPEEYANYGIFAAALAFLGIIIDFGMPLAILRNFNGGGTRSLSDIASAITGAKLLMLAALPTAGAILYLSWDAIGVRFTQTWAFIPVLLAIAYLDGRSEVLATVCRVFHRVEYFAAGRIANALATISAGVLLVLVAGLGVMGALLALLAGELFAFATYALVVNRKLGIAGGRLDRDALRGQLAFSLPLVPNRLAGWARLLAVRPILAHLVPMTSVGLFSFASSLAALPNLVSTAIDLALAPVYFQRRDAMDAKTFSSKVYAFATVYLASMFPLWVSAILFVPEAVRLVGAAPYMAAVPVCTILLCASYVRMQLPFLVRQIHFLRKTWTLPLITIPSTLLGLGAIVMCVRGFGIVAAAWITLGMDVLILISLAWTVRRYEHIDYPLATALVFTTALAALAMWSDAEQGSIGSVDPIWMKAGIVVVVAILCITVWIWPRRRFIAELAKG